MSEKPIGPLRRRMLEDMAVRRLGEKAQSNYIRQIETFTLFLGRSPDTATAEDVRRFQVHLTETGVGPSSINQAATSLRFFFGTTLDRDRLHQKGGDLRSAVQGLGRDHAHNRGRSQASGCPHRYHFGAAHLGLGHDPPSPRAHDRARRWALLRWQPLDRHQAQLLPAGAGALQAVPPPDAGEACRRTCGRQAQLLWCIRPSRGYEGVRRLPGAAEEDKVVRLLQAAFRRSSGGVGVSIPLYPASPSPTAV